MNSYLQFISFLVLLLISCGGSKSDVNDPTLSSSGNYNNSNTNLNTNTGNNTNTAPITPPQSYTFNNELVWADEFDEDSSLGTPACLLYTSDAADE